MKAILLTLMFAITAKAEPFDLVCVTEFPSTSHIAEVKDGQLKVRVIHHNGTKYMPAYTGVMTPNDLPKVTRATEILPKLGDEWSFSWPLNKCKFKNEHRFECFGGAEKVVLNGVEVLPFAIYTTQAHEDGVAGTRDITTVELSLYINDEGFMTAMPYQKSECLRTNSK